MQAQLFAGSDNRCGNEDVAYYGDEEHGSRESNDLSENDDELGGEHNHGMEEKCSGEGESESDNLELELLGHC